MVQYVFTPWRDRRELLKVRQQFYPDGYHPSTSSSSPTMRSSQKQAIGTSTAKADDGDDDTEASQYGDKQNAVARVYMWMQRGGCPHMVESTALLMAAILSDGGASAGSATYAARAAYAAAFSRFVTGLLDSHQDKQRKLSMYSVAKTIGLPATFVELRHQATHEQLPSLGRLRSAARKALDWIWEYYWKHLGEADDHGEDRACRGALMRYLASEHEDDAGREALWRQIRCWDEVTVLRVLAEIGETAGDNALVLRSVRLARKILEKPDEPEGEEEKEDGRRITDLDQIRHELAQSRLELQRLEEDVTAAKAPAAQKTQETEESTKGNGWSRYQGLWTPKPIGVV